MAKLIVNEDVKKFPKHHELLTSKGFKLHKHDPFIGSTYTDKYDHTIHVDVDGSWSSHHPTYHQYNTRYNRRGDDYKSLDTYISGK
jgi:hypothetical protein